MIKTNVWIRRTLSGLAAIFLAFDSVFKLLHLQSVLDATRELGFPQDSIVPTGLLLLACTVVYVIPRTSVAGAVLLTGYLGGAVAAHMRVGDSLLETSFPVIMGSLVWSGLFVRDQRVRILLRRPYTD